MKYLVLLITTCSLLIVSISCKKGPADFTLKGVITDNSFSTPLDAAVVKLYGTVAGGSSVDLIAESTLGADGAYSFVFERTQIETYHLSVTKSNYFDLYLDIPFSDLTIEEDNVRNYAATAKSWVKLRFYNDNPQVDDIFQYIRQEGKIDCDECCPDGNIYLNGAVDTTIYCINDGNSEYRYYYWVHNSSNQGPRSAITVPFDTVEIDLTF